MTNSICNRVWRGLLPVALISVGVAATQSAWAQAESRVTAVSGDTDADLFDTRLIGGVPVAYDETALPVVPPSAERCVETPNLLSPDAVFSPSAPTPPPMSNMPSYGSLSPGQGALTAQNNVPAFLGDFFAGPGITIASIPVGMGLGVVSIPSSTAVGLMKFAEGSSPRPRDRVFVSYNYFDKVNLIPGGIPVNRLTPGIEKTFFDGNVSVEVRMPMAWTLNSTTPFDTQNLQVIDYDSNHYELGNLTTFLKVLLYDDERLSVSAGLGVSLPTANDLRVVSPNPAATLDVINNQAVHLLPFVGAIYTPSDRWFTQGVLQLDVATNGNSVYTTNQDLTLIKEGVLNDPTFLFMSLGNGYWVHRAADPAARLTGIALLTELHFNTTLQATDAVNGVNANIGARQSQIQTTNAVIGTNLMFDQNKSLSLGYVVPIGGGADRAFDGEFRLLFNWYFGGPVNRMGRAQF